MVPIFNYLFFIFVIGNVHLFFIVDINVIIMMLINLITIYFCWICLCQKKHQHIDVFSSLVPTDSNRL